MKEISGFEGRYSVTEDGRVYSFLTDRYLRPKHHSNGYYVVTLMRADGKHCDCLVHRLVCRAFHGDPTHEQTDVNHINGLKSDNRSANLEWCTRSQNMVHAETHGLMRRQIESVRESNKRRAQKVRGTNPNGDVVEFPTVTLARQSGFAKVSDCLLGLRKTSGGYSWQRI
jgi:hypothetical protein